MPIINGYSTECHKFSAIHHFNTLQAPLIPKRSVPIHILSYPIISFSLKLLPIQITESRKATIKRGRNYANRNVHINYLSRETRGRDTIKRDWVLNRQWRPIPFPSRLAYKRITCGATWTDKSLALQLGKLLLKT